MPSLQQRGDDPKRSNLAELIPLQSVDCNPGCTIPNLGCGIPFSFSDCSEETISCVDIKVKGNLPYGNHDVGRTAAWATKLMAQPLRILDPLNKDAYSYQIQPNNTQVYLGHDYDGQDPLSKYEEERANFREEDRAEREKDIETFREALRKEGRDERKVNWILDHNTYAALQIWSAQCITCQGVNTSLTGGSIGLRTSAQWELIPGGTNPMGAPQELSVSHGALRLPLVLLLAERECRRGRHERAEPDIYR